MTESLPSYDVTGEQPPIFQSQGHQMSTFVLGLDEVHTAKDSSQPVYKLSQPISRDEGAVVTFTIQKVHYDRIPAEGDDSSSAAQFEDIYTFQMSSRNVVITSTQSSDDFGRRTHESATLIPSILGWDSCIVHDHFKCELNGAGRLAFGNNHIAWKSINDELLAVETLTRYNKDGTTSHRPQLMMQKVLEEHDLDLLVVCWLSRAWKQAEKEAKENTKRGKFKKFFSNPNKSNDPKRNVSIGVASAAGTIDAFGNMF